jgi:putative ABC transport system permease protein
MNIFLADVRYAVRGLLRSPGVSAVAVLTLALGIGASTAIFSVFDVVLLRPLPYRDAERLYAIHEMGATGTLIPVNALHFREWRASTRSFDEMALVGPAGFTLGGVGEPLRIDVARVTPSLFRTLGVEPALGRAFLEEEDVPGRDSVVVLGHDFWMARFSADPAVIGRRVTLDGAPHEIVGVLPPDAGLPKLQHLYAGEATLELGRPQLWKPFAATARDLRPLGSFNYAAIARLKPDVSASQANEELNAVQAELARRAPEPAELRAAVVPLSDQIVSRSSVALRLVLAAVAMVLFIACANITNLLLAQGGRRHREFAIRRAAGANQRRLIGQILMESLVLSTAAGIGGLIVGAVLVRVVQLSAPIDVPRIDEATLDGRVLLFTFGVTFCSGVLIGLLPAWRATQADAVDLLRSSSVTAVGGSASGRLRSLLMTVEVAASAICLVVGALLLSSFVTLMSVERGFDADRVTTVDFFLPAPRYDMAGGVRFITTLAERVRSLPGVVSAGITDALPLSGVANSAIMVEGSNLPRLQRPIATIRFADAGYFQTMGMALRAGRLLEEVDAGRGLAVISTGAAERLWPQQNPIGKRFRYGPDDSPWVDIVGVVSDVRAVALTADPPLHVYRPAADYFYGRASLAVKTRSNPAAVAPVVQQIMRELDPELALPTPRTMEDIVAASVAQRRFQMNLMLLLAAAAVFLAGLGIYAVVSQSVAQRTGEFGIRVALGATSGNILHLVLRYALRPVLVGLGAGIVTSLGLGQFLRSLLFGVSPTDPMPFVAAGMFLVSVALLASFTPAWRAARVDPMVALRHE